MSNNLFKYVLYSAENDGASENEEDDLAEDFPYSLPIKPTRKPMSESSRPDRKKDTSHRETMRSSTIRHAREPRRGGAKRGPTSVSTVESVSTITADDPETQEDVKQVYQELQEINDKLKREFKILHQRDLVLKQKEESLSDLQSSLEKAIDNEVKRRLAAKEQEFQVDLNKLDFTLKEKSRENKRLKENFDALKAANDILRKELDTLTQAHDKLEKQHGSVQARLINLQRKQEHDEKKDSLVPLSFSAKVKQISLPVKDPKSAAAKKPKSVLNTCEVLSSLLDWVCESQLRQSVTDQPTKLVAHTTSQEQLEDRCFKILPALVELLREHSLPASRMTLPCLQFIYWSLVILENSQSQHQKTSLTSTLRRLGEDLYRGKTVRVDVIDSTQLMAPPGESGDKQKDKAAAAVFCKSSHLHTRLLSSLIVLKTITQVDYLAQVYETLRNDLKSDSGKEFFLYYQASPIMLSHLKPSNKALTSNALDVYLQMSMDSPYVRNFLDSCSQEKWFQSVSLIWRMPGIEAKQQEKISIILQKLSKIKSNKKYFEVFGLTTSCQEVQRSSSAQSPFLSLNLKSILFNLNVTKAPPKAST